MFKALENRKALFNYDRLEEWPAGLELLGHEVKALRAGYGSLEGTYVTIRGGEAWLVGATIPPYQANNTPEDYDPVRPRRLLLHKDEIAKLAEKSDRDRLTIIPLRVYNHGPRFKLMLALARGKKRQDKRETIKRRDTEREIERTLKQRR